MKKLFVLGTFLTIFLFLFGCQSESPVSPNSQVNALEKGRQVRFTGNLAASVTNGGFEDIALNWKTIKGADSIKVLYYDAYLQEQTEKTFPGTSTSCDIYNVMMQLSDATCDITIEALKVKKGNLVVVASSSQTFTYTGSSLEEINITGSIFASGSNNYTNIVANWNAIPGAYFYYVIDNTSWGSNNYNGMIAGTLWAASNNHSLTAGDYVIFEVKGYTSSGGLIAIGITKFTYNP